MQPTFAIEQVQAGYCYSYILESDGEAVVVDPNITKIQAYRDHLRKNRLKLAAIVDTHTHADHLSGAAILAGEYDRPIAMSANAVSSLNVQRVEDGDVITFGRARLEVMAAPGHTDDSIALLADGAIFTGDVLLINSVGRTDFQNGSPEDMFDTLARLKGLADDTVVYPAHDYSGRDRSTIGVEKASNPFMLEADKQAFGASARSKVLEKPFNMDAIIHSNREGLAREIEYVPAGVARDRLEAGEGWRVLDVRQPDEFEAARIADSVNIPLELLSGRLEEVMDSDEKYILFCQSGARASMAASILLAAGVSHVSVLEGGLKAWRKAKAPVIAEKVPFSLERQVRMAAGSLVLIGGLLAWLVNTWFLVIPIWVGAGLFFAAVSNSCLMAELLMRLPYNRKAIARKSPAGGTCSLDGGPDGGGCAM